ncbi:hypothetical protein M413DRAFT_32149 [Hebeloma cylindrosporum]|uniref:Protein kinase domain-containing protein n=1 Tax=Hebeloma cylindrosporum TaxID=76867 RepID=A0A0C2Y4B9_HEBCY|nr:hypothetical protein M413DRAFT_32149 [Hebeloma cylindrosporum h7]
MAHSAMGRSTWSWSVYDLKSNTVVTVGNPWDARPKFESANVQGLHRRLLTNVAHSISKFQSSRQLVQAIHDAYLAHRDAFLICGILHRDISVRNILRSVGGNGILNDWDMARKVKDVRSGPRQPGRTGTWWFMSIKLLDDPTTLHELQDDLESFCYVVLYTALRYLPHNHVTDLQTVIATVFEDHYTTRAEVRGGGAKMAVVNGRGAIRRDLEFTDNQPLTNWIDVALEVIQDWYRYLDYLEKQKSVRRGPSFSAITLKLDDRPMRNHSYLDQQFRSGLEQEWPENDEAVDLLNPSRKIQRWAGAGSSGSG